MISFELEEQTKTKLDKLLKINNFNYDKLISELLDYKINEAKRGIRNIELDLSNFEERYSLSSEEFYSKFSSGELENTHQNDFLIWSGEYEIYQSLQNELKTLL